MGRFHACMKICPQKATEGVCILLYCKWRGKLVTDAQKQSIHACRRDKTKNSAAAQSIVRSICPKSMPWNSPGMPESGRMKKRRTDARRGTGFGTEKYSLFFQARLKSKAASYSGTEKGRENKTSESTARQVRFQTAQSR